MAPYVGRPLKRFEDPRLVTGQGSFVDDLRLPGMLHAIVLRSPHAHARILSLDAAPARALPGAAAELLLLSVPKTICWGMPLQRRTGGATVPQVSGHTRRYTCVTVATPSAGCRCGLKHE